MTGAIAQESTVHWDGAAVVAVDQTLLPHACRSVRLGSVDDVVEAIGRLVVRGAPAIGVVGAFGVVLSVRANTVSGHTGGAAVRADAERLARARPTAVTLGWAVGRALARLDDGPEAVLQAALEIMHEVEQSNRGAATRAAGLIRRICKRPQLRVLTHCNTGRFATVAWGTALGAIRVLADEARVEEVLVGETRPLLQGARLTTWELAQLGIPHRLCIDAAGPASIAAGMVDCVLVGADRVAANGDVANKIGTYALAIAAERHGVPFVVVAPESTIDSTIADGSAIQIEERDPEEILAFGDARVAPADTAVFNPAFDVTPAELITAIATDRRLIACEQHRRSPSDAAWVEA
jgi:S-methyl-5-thioribose-1-phosphate isomerase